MFRKGSRRTKWRGVTTYQRTLRLEAFLTEVMRDRLAPHGVTEVGGASINMLKDALGQRGLVEQRRFIMMCSGVGAHERFQGLLRKA